MHKNTLTMYIYTINGIVTPLASIAVRLWVMTMAVRVNNK